MTIAFGEFSGGALVVDGEFFANRECWLAFDAARPHHVAPVDGWRTSVTLFTPRHPGKLQTSFEDLADLGFPVSEWHRLSGWHSLKPADWLPAKSAESWSASLCSPRHEGLALAAPCTSCLRTRTLCSSSSTPSSLESSAPHDRSSGKMVASATEHPGSVRDPPASVTTDYQLRFSPSVDYGVASIPWEYRHDQSVDGLSAYPCRSLRRTSSTPGFAAQGPSKPEGAEHVRSCRDAAVCDWQLSTLQDLPQALEVERNQQHMA
eukprot:328285-Amphidinium_carterae.1